MSVKAIAIKSMGTITVSLCLLPLSAIAGCTGSYYSEGTYTGTGSTSPLFYEGSYTSVVINKNVSIIGTLSVTGAISKATGSFVIDHPLDPKNKLLYHSFVESPD